MVHEPVPGIRTGSMWNVQREGDQKERKKKTVRKDRFTESWGFDTFDANKAHRHFRTRRERNVWIWVIGTHNAALLKRNIN